MFRLNKIRKVSRKKGLATIEAAAYAAIVIIALIGVSKAIEGGAASSFLGSSQQIGGDRLFIPGEGIGGETTTMNDSTTNTTSGGNYSSTKGGSTTTTGGINNDGVWQ